MNENKTKKIRKNKSKKVKNEKDFNLYIGITLLLIVGIVMVYSASSYYALYEEGDVFYFFKQHIVWVILGVISMIIISYIDYHILRKLTRILFVVTLVLLIATFFVGEEINGARRWLNVAGVTFQPSEIAKYAVVFILASRIDKIKKYMEQFAPGIAVNFIIAGVFAGLVYIQNSMSIAMVILMMSYLMIFIGGAKKKTMYGLIPIGVVAVFVMMRSEAYRWERFITFTNPWKYATDEGYQLVHSLYAIGSGGVTGVGLGNSMQKALYMPEPHNDFIFAVLGEEFGLIGCLVVIAIYLYFIISAFRVAGRAKDNYGRLLAVGITLIIAIQAIINIAVVTGSMPVTGVPLPFISYGGTALVINLSAVGVLLNISTRRKL